MRAWAPSPAVLPVCWRLEKNLKPRKSRRNFKFMIFMSNLIKFQFFFARNLTNSKISFQVISSDFSKLESETRSEESRAAKEFDTLKKKSQRKVSGIVTTRCEFQNSRCFVPTSIFDQNSIQNSQYRFKFIRISILFLILGTNKPRKLPSPRLRPPRLRRSAMFNLLRFSKKIFKKIFQNFFSKIFFDFFFQKTIYKTKTR